MNGIIIKNLVVMEKKTIKWNALASFLLALLLCAGAAGCSDDEEREGREAILRLQERDNREDESPQGAEVGPRAHRAPPSLTTRGPRRGRWNRPTPFNRRWSGATPADSATTRHPTPAGSNNAALLNLFEVLPTGRDAYPKVSLRSTLGYAHSTSSRSRRAGVQERLR